MSSEENDTYMWLKYGGMLYEKTDNPGYPGQLILQTRTLGYLGVPESYNYALLDRARINMPTRKGKIVLKDRIFRVVKSEHETFLAFLDYSGRSEPYSGISCSAYL